MNPTELRKTLHLLSAPLGPGEAIRTFLALLCVAERHGVTQQEIAAELGLTTTGASQLFRRLREAGLINSELHPAHRSHRLVTLTPAGLDLMHSAGVRTQKA